MDQYGKRQEIHRDEGREQRSFRQAEEHHVEPVDSRRQQIDGGEKDQQPVVVRLARVADRQAKERAETDQRYHGQVHEVVVVRVTDCPSRTAQTGS